MQHLPRTLVTLIILQAALVMPVVAFASETPCRDGQKRQLPDCLYLGAGAGISQLQPDDSTSSFRVSETRSNSIKLHVGYYLNPRWFTELAYQQLGSARLENRNPAISDKPSVSYSNINLTANYLLFNPENRWNLFLRAGVGLLQTKEKGNLDIERQQGSQLTLGAGAHWQISRNWFARAELDGFDKDARQAGVSLSYLFARKPRLPETPELAPEPEPQKTEAKPTPAPTPAIPVAVIVPTDGDGDGILDDVDECPNTPVGALVDNRGCHKVLEQPKNFDLQINFDTNSSRVSNFALTGIDTLAEFMTRYPDAIAEVSGHTDSIGRSVRNQALSEARADAVKTLLVRRYNIAPQRINAVGYGERYPLASNNTREGRAINRRVTARVYTP